MFESPNGHDNTRKQHVTYSPSPIWPTDRQCVGWKLWVKVLVASSEESTACKRKQKHITWRFAAVYLTRESHYYLIIANKGGPNGLLYMSFSFLLSYVWQHWVRVKRISRRICFIGLTVDSSLQQQCRCTFPFSYFPYKDAMFAMIPCCAVSKYFW